MTLVIGTFFYHQYFSFLTLLMFNSIDFSLPPKPSALPPLCPYIENPAAVPGMNKASVSSICSWVSCSLFSFLFIMAEKAIMYSFVSVWFFCLCVSVNRIAQNCGSNLHENFTEWLYTKSMEQSIRFWVTLKVEVNRGQRSKSFSRITTFKIMS